ncbi:vimentin-type intermediate filament-associated coiled-coil protein [Podarcis muralis]
MAASSPAAWAPPTPVQIREANAHLAALHGRVAELEARLAAAEETVRGQAGSLIRKDAETRRALEEAGRQKGREIAALEEQLRSSEERVQELLGLIREKDGLILRLRHRSRLLGEICRCRPVLDTLLAQMSEGERLGPDSGDDSPDGLLPDSNCVPDGARDFSLGSDPQDSDMALFGTTV